MLDMHISSEAYLNYSTSWWLSPKENWYLWVRKADSGKLFIQTLVICYTQIDVYYARPMLVKALKQTHAVVKASSLPKKF